MIETGVLLTLSLLCVSITFLNGLCIYVILKTPRLRQHSIIAIANLLFCHLIQGLIVIPSYMVKRMDIRNIAYSRPACDAFRFSYMTTNYIAVVSLLLITFDRLCAIKWPMVYKVSVTNAKMTVAIGIIWLYVLVLCILPFFPVTHCSKCGYQPSKTWSISMLTVNTFLPMLLIFACYTVIYFTARNSNSPSTQNHTAVAMRITKISVTVVSAFILCWGPSLVYYFLLSTCPQCFSTSFKDSELENVLNFVMKVLTFVDGIVAPLIYCLMHKGIRSGILQTARNFCNICQACRKFKIQKGRADNYNLEAAETSHTISRQPIVSR